MPRTMSMLLTGSFALLVSATIAGAQIVRTAPGGPPTLTLAVPGRAALTAPVQSIDGLPEAIEAPDAAALGAQGKPTVARPPVARPPTPPRRATLALAVLEREALTPVLRELRTCLVTGRNCPFDAIVTTSAGTFVAPAALMTTLNVTAINGATALTFTFTTAALARR
jgi:hypothetical protein